jgi:hypothetical protein
MHPNDDELYPPETVVRIKKTGEFAIIKNVVFMMAGNGFLHYEGIIEGKGDGRYALYHEDVEVEALP